MHLHRMQRHKFIIIILSIFLKPSSSSSDLNCSDDKPFECGNIGYLTYPFWGGHRPSECGREGFELVCGNNIPTLTISSLSYLVQKLDFSTNTLTVARQDLHDTTCPGVPLHNTTVDWDLFRQPLVATDRNITLYFDCSGSSSRDEPNNAFPCNNRSNNFFTVGGENRSCRSNIYVPINNNDAESLENPTPSSINILRSALTAGFSIQWLKDTKQLQSPFCNAQIYSSCIPMYRSRRSCPYLRTCSRQSPDSPSSTGNLQGPAPAPNIDLPPSDHVMPPAPTQSRPPGIGNAPGLPPLPITTGSQTQIITKGKSSAKEIVIVAVVALSLVATIIASISIHCLLKRRRLATGLNPQHCKRDVENFLLQQGTLTPKRFKYCEIKKMTKSFSVKLGQGGYGSVYKGMMPDGCPVAVKILIETDSNGEEFINEVASISRTSHINIVTLLGFCYEGKRRALVYEFMPNCSLDKFLNNNQSAGSMACRLDLDKLYEIAVGIAKGLEYLHTGCKTRIVHFDIKPQNILLDEDLCPKISDFGLAKLCKKKQSILSVPGTRGTAGYIAPEVFSRNFGGVSHKSDVYSYGMMLLEMAGARKLSEAEVIQSSENYFPDKIYEQVMSNVTKKIDDLTMELAEEESRTKMCVVGFWCIQTIPSNRPSISKVVEMLEGSVESIEIPPKPFLFAPNLPTHQTWSSSSAYITENSARD